MPNLCPGSIKQIYNVRRMQIFLVAAHKIYRCESRENFPVRKAAGTSVIEG